MIYEKELYHYLVIHFPIALFITGYMFDLLGYFRSNSIFSKFSFWNLFLGIFWGILSIISGLLTDQVIGHMDNPFPIWTTHGTHMICAVIFFAILFYMKILISKEKIKIHPILVLIIHTLILLFFIHGAHIGAKLADRL